MNSKPFKELSYFLSFDFDSQEFLDALNNKKIREFRLISRAIFKEIAKELEITEYKIENKKTNYCEPAEVSFYSEHLYITFSNPNGATNLLKEKFMFRYTKSMTDYSGGCNNWMSYKFLCENTEGAIEYFMKVLDNSKIPVTSEF